MPGGLFCAIGNPLTDGTWTYTWEKGRQLKCMSESGTTASFKYNENGLRIQKTVNGVVTNYTLHGKNIMHMTQGSNSLHFYYDASNKPAIVEFNGTKYSYILNLQGDVLGLVDSNGTEVVKYVYDAWGKILSTTCSLASTLGTIQPFRYRGYVYDEETELYYLQSRYYNCFMCRFINADDKVLADYDVWDAKQFTYCGNNPVRYEDPSGNSFWDTLQKVAEAALVVAAVVAVAALVIGTGGGAGFALAGGGALASSATAGALGYAAANTAAAGATLLFASKVGRDMSEYYQKKGTPKSNKAQNQQFDEAVRQLRKNHGIDMTKDRIRRLHDAITKHGYDLYEIIEVGLELFGR